MTTTDAERPAASSLDGMSVRELVALLAFLEDAIRPLPPLVALRGRLVVNPDRRRLAARQRAVREALRSRHVAQRPRLSLVADDGDARTSPA